jgi:hypothetical protein
MTGNYRKLSISFAIVALAALNVWRWWPAASTSPHDEAGRAVGAFNVDDFVVKAIPVDSLPPVSRDIFQQKKIVVAKPRVIAPLSTAPLAPVKTPEEIAKENAQAEFSQIQCVGISVRNARTHAYLISAGEPSLVSKGDKVGSHFMVENITTDGVSLHDPETGVGGIIAVSGKK